MRLLRSVGFVCLLTAFVMPVCLMSAFPPISYSKNAFHYLLCLPLTLTDKATSRSVNITILDREMYKSGIFSFEDLWNIYHETDNPDYDENAGSGDDE
jgi:hypothetical protein